MKREELKDKISSILSSVQFPEIVSDTLNISCGPGELLKVAETLKDNEELKFDFLFSLTAIDWPEDMEVIYHMRSSEFDNEVVLRVRTGGRENPEVPTSVNIWPTAELHEREVYDLFGINFKDHPDMRRIFLEDDWVGYPMRKDYVDEINIVDL